MTFQILHGDAPQPMRLLEMFCGTKSVGKEFGRAGFDVVSLDFKPEFNATVTADILTLPDDYFDCYGPFDAVWASPPCEGFSVAVIGRNWNHDHTPKSDSARLGLRILEKTVAIIKHVVRGRKQDQEKGRNPAMFWIENPRGKMRRMPIMQQFTRQTVSYCQYGDTRMKPTDIWTNTNWIPRPMCKNGDNCHEAAPRGSKTGTQGIKGAKDRSVIPAELCRELAEYASARTPQPIRMLRQLELFADAR